MHLIILASREGWHTRELARAVRARGHSGEIVPYEGLTATIGGRQGLRSGAAELDRADAVLARIIPSGSLEQIIFRVDALHRLEDRGIRVVNSPRTIERTVDKFWTSALLEQCGLPTPDTVVCETAEEAFAGLRALGGDVIVKPLFGSMGLGMVRVSDEEMAYRVFRTIEQIRGVYYLQRAIGHDGRDVRAFVVGGRVLGAIERRSEGWRTNLARGGTARALVLSPEWSALAVRAAAAVGAEYAGVDLLPDERGGIHLLEVNGIPGWRGLQEATGLDVADALVEQVERGQPVTGGEVAAAAQLACLLEVSAPKPGNVSPGRGFHDTCYEDFLASAVAIGPALAAAGERPLGVTIRAAVEDTCRWARSNTNLGMVLLLAPLARAARREGGGLRDRLTAVLAETTVADADQVYAAIRRARPGGLGHASAEDVGTAPTVTLRQAMTLAADRDTVAGEYISDFSITFGTGVPAVRDARADGLSWSDATVEAFLSILADVPDTHIARKLGGDEAGRIARRAGDVRAAGGVRTDAGRAALASLDDELRDARNARNPGTTADLTCAALFVVILEDGWNI